MTFELAQDTNAILEHEGVDADVNSAFVSVVLGCCKYSADVRGDAQTRLGIAAFIAYCRLTEDADGVKEYPAVLNTMPPTPIKEVPSRDDFQAFRKEMFRRITGTSLDF